MKLYHYSKPLYEAIRTKANLGIATQEEIIKENEWSKLVNSPGSYHDHVSFFFDPLPLKTLAKIFHGANEFWINGNKIYEYIIDIRVLNSDILFYITESPYQVETLSKTDWVYTDEFKIKYMRNKHKEMKEMGEIGNGIKNLETQINKYKGKTEDYYLKASKQYDFEDNIKKYAASVPHVMLYPSGGSIKIETTSKCIVGKDEREIISASVDKNHFIDIPKELLERANEDPILAGYIKSDRKRIGIFFKEKIVGFFQPCEIEYKKQIYWRTGNIYVLPEYRNKGLASKVIADFFTDKQYGLAHIAENNPSSLKAFEKNGFINTGVLPDKNPKGKSLYLMVKKPINVKSAFVNW